MANRLLNIAHRGASAWAPENTMAAFKLACDMGADGFELDVQLSADGQVVVIHDGSVNRTTNGTGRVANLTLAQIQRLDAGLWFNSVRSRRAKTEYIDERIPLLQEVLELAKQQNKFLYIELKFVRDSLPGLEEKVTKLLDQYGMVHNVIIESFRHDAIRRVKEIALQFRTAALFARSLAAPRHSVRKLIESARECRADEIALEKTMITNRVVNAADTAGLSIVAWTVNSHFYLRHCIKLGLKGIITNYPDRLAAMAPTV
jgi:glycerophosphoryl diester phosphodiesterase